MWNRDSPVSVVSLHNSDKLQNVNKPVPSVLTASYSQHKVMVDKLVHISNLPRPYLALCLFPLSSILSVFLCFFLSVCFIFLFSLFLFLFVFLLLSFSLCPFSPLCFLLCLSPSVSSSLSLSSFPLLLSVSFSLPRSVFHNLSYVLYLPIYSLSLNFYLSCAFSCAPLCLFCPYLPLLTLPVFGQRLMVKHGVGGGRLETDGRSEPFWFHRKSPGVLYVRSRGGRQKGVQTIYILLKGQ